VRVDTGIEEGSEVSMYYDPMIAKLITSGDNREQAIERMGEALDAYYIRGVSHNISFLNALISHPRFRAGKLSTNLIAEEYPDGFHTADVPRDDPKLAIIVAATIHRRLMDRAARLSGQLPSHERRVGSDFVVCIGNDQHPVAVVALDEGCEVRLDDETFRVQTAWRFGEPLVRVEINGKPSCLQLDRIGVRYRLTHRGAQTDALVCEPRTAALNRLMIAKTPPDLSKFLLSPMPGLLVRLTAKVGQELKAGEEIAVIEAMKMENSLRATDDVTIAKVLVEQGQSLVVDQPIVEFG
jgi:propionyl-CoA carboxylase alpha chain